MEKPLFNLPDSNYQFWKNFTYFGELVTFDHLSACKHTFSHPKRAESHTLYFTFSHHVFTKKVQSNRMEIYPFPPEDLRLFDSERYELSKYLPEIIASLPEQFCYHGGYSKYCTCKIHRTNGNDIYYQVVYRTWKQRGKIRFHIESAYPLENRLGKVKKVNFWVICHNLLHNKKLPHPPK